MDINNTSLSISPRYQAQFHESPPAAAEDIRRIPGGTTPTVIIHRDLFNSLIAREHLELVIGDTGIHRFGRNVKWKGILAPTGEDGRRN